MTGSGGPTRSRSSSRSPDRVALRCPIAGPGGCGGCDFQHVVPGRAAPAEGGGGRRAVAPARRLGVVRRGGGGVDRRNRRRAALAHPDALSRRRRRSGRSAPSTAHIELIRCRPAAARSPRRRSPAVAGSRWPRGQRDRHGRRRRGRRPCWSTAGWRPETLVVTEHAAGRTSRWPRRLLAGPSGRRRHAGRRGAGRPGPATRRAGPRPLLRSRSVRGGPRRPGCRVWGVEADRTAVEHARRNVPEARFTAARVERALKTGSSTRSSPTLPEAPYRLWSSCDPPRSGAGRP